MECMVLFSPFNFPTRFPKMFPQEEGTERGRKASRGGRKANLSSRFDAINMMSFLFNGIRLRECCGASTGQTGELPHTRDAKHTYEVPNISGPTQRRPTLS